MLQLELTEPRSWYMEDRNVRSEPRRVAAVLFLDGAPKYSDWRPTEDVLRFFQPRGDKQILSVELLSIALGPSTFGEVVAGTRVFTWSANKGAEHILKTLPGVVKREVVQHNASPILGTRDSDIAAPNLEAI